MPTIATPTPASKDFFRSPRQLRALQQKGRNRPGEGAASGIRIDRRWARDLALLEIDLRTNLDLANAVAWMHARRGARMSDTDRDTIAAVENRSWRFGECSAMHMRSLPSWLVEILPARRGGGYRDFVSFILGAYRAGALGVLIGYAEAMAVCHVASESTWRRWTSELEDLGIIRITQTWSEDPTGERPRVYGRSLYQLGPTALEVGASAELEGVATGRADYASRAAAIELRKTQRRADRDRLGELRDRRSPHDTPAYRPSKSVFAPTVLAKDEPERDVRFPGVPDDIRTGGDASITREIVADRYRQIAAQNSVSLQSSAVARSASPSVRTNRTPLRHCDNRNALPSFVGGDTTTPPADGAGGSWIGASTPKGADAIGQASALAEVPTATMLVDMLRRLGMAAGQIDRIAGAGASRSSESTAKAVPENRHNRPSEVFASRTGQGSVGASEAATRSTQRERPDESPIAGLTGPLARQLHAFFLDRRRD